MLSHDFKENAIHPIFKTSNEDIKSLNDEQARELIARLCKAELLKQGIPASGVTWGGDQRASDGGIDVKVDSDCKHFERGFLLRPLCGIQVKAEKFTAGRISGEMKPRGTLRPSIAELLKNDGAYIIVSTRDSVSERYLNERRAAMRDVLTEAGLNANSCIDFYGTRKIADWVETLPSVSIWLKQQLGKDLTGWQSYGPWAYRETDPDAEYLIDEQVRVYVPNRNEGQDTKTAITKLRNELSESVSIRIVGLSGVGKTRLVQALFDARIATDSFMPSPDNLIYTDISDEPAMQPGQMLEALIASKSHCVVIVDNCGAETHSKLTEIINRTECQLKLITVEYDIRDDLPETTSCFRLEGVSDAVIIKLIKQRYSVISNNDADRIAEFSAGNARIAFALADSAEQTGELAQLRDAELFDRLFLQKNSEDKTLRTCAEVASLVYSFNAVDIGAGSHLDTLAILADVTPISFHRNIVRLQKRGLVQERGVWKAVLPHAIANRLGACAIENIPTSILKRVFVDTEDNHLTRSFTRRLGYLHESKAAVQIASDMMVEGGRLSNICDLNEIEEQMFTNIAPLNPAATLAAISKATDQEAFISTENIYRHRYIQLLSSIAYDQESFAGAVKLLEVFSLAEPKDYRNNSAKEHIFSLFRLILSGTHAPLKQRVNVATEYLRSQNEERQALGVLMLDTALEADFFGGYHSEDFGARKRDCGWWPKGHDEKLAWFSKWLDVAAKYGCENTAFGRDVRGSFAHRIRGLWMFDGLHRKICDLIDQFRSVDGFPQGWLAIRSVIDLDVGKKGEPGTITDAEEIEALRRLERRLTPDNLENEIRARIISRYAFGLDLEDDEVEADSADERYEGKSDVVQSYYRANDMAKALGKSLCADDAIFTKLLPELLSTQGFESIWHFGRGIGENHENVLSCLEQINAYLDVHGDQDVYFGLVLGIVGGWAHAKPEESDAFFNASVHDSFWGKYFVSLQLQTPIGQAEYDRIFACFDNGITPTFQFSNLQGGRATDSLSVEQITAVTSRLLERGDGGLHAALSILRMVVHDANEKDNAFKLRLGAALRYVLRGIEWSAFAGGSSLRNSHLNKITRFALNNGAEKQEVREILDLVIVGLKNSKRYFVPDFAKFLSIFFEVFPEIALDSVYFLDEDGGCQTAINLVSSGINRRQSSGITVVPTSVLINWCKTSPQDRCLFAAATCRLVKTAPNDKDKILRISETAIQILAMTPSSEKERVLAEFAMRLRSGSGGSYTSQIRRSIDLLPQFNPDGNDALNALLEALNAELQERLKHYQKQELARERTENSSFE